MKGFAALCCVSLAGCALLAHTSCARAQERRISLMTRSQVVVDGIHAKNLRRQKTIESLFGRLRSVIETPAPQTPKASILSPVPIPVPLVKPQFKVAATPARAKYCRVAPGDTFIGLARRYYGSPSGWQTIAHANNLDVNKPLRIGQQLFIPPMDASPSQVAQATRCAEQAGIVPPKNLNRYTAPSETPLNYKKYEWKVYDVQPGDTLASVARRFVPSPGGIELLARYNRIDAGTPLLAGSNVRVPMPRRDKIRERYLLATQGIFE